MTKKNSIIVSLSLTVLLTILTIFAKELKLSLCGHRAVGCWENYNLFSLVLLLSPILLLTSLISLKASDEAFNRWKNMTLYFIPAYLLIVILTPWDMGNAMAGPSLSKGMVALALCIIYLIFSVFYLFTQSRKTS